jgi:DNA replication and repair protein RecF
VSEGLAIATAGLRLLRLRLEHFRSYAALTWEPRAGVVVITGPNGSGKTNVLEAISLLVPGRGVRGARAGEFVRTGETVWAVHGRFATPEGAMEVATGSAPEGGERRVFRLDGVAPRAQAAVAERLACVWLTPQMDRLFQEGLGGRRRFLDRLVYALMPGHAREVAAFEAAMAGRNRLLAEGRMDAAWLAGLEDSMARHAVAATASRMALVSRLNAAGPAGDFPRALMGLNCAIASRLEAAPAVDVEDWLREALRAGRGDDRARGSAGVGAHRADMTLADAASGLPAGLASTGQQKALLLGVVLAHAAVLASARGFAPLLLLDEPLVHLDASRRGALLEVVLGLPAQVFMTGTDASAFVGFSGCEAPLFT